MSVHSAGVLLFRFNNRKFIEFFLVHPGGPFWAKKNDGVWSIPKGIFEEGEEPLDAAKREFKEETGFELEGDFIELGLQQQPSRKIIHAWALEKDLDATKIISNTFTMEWPKNSGVMREYPEVDKGEWFGLGQARIKILKGQAMFIDLLLQKIGYSPKSEEAIDEHDFIQGSLF